MIMMLALDAGVMAGESVQLWAADSMSRVYLTQKVDADAPSSMKLSACRNEWESVQVIATGKAAQLARCAFSLSQPKHDDGTLLPAPRIFWEYDVPVKKSSPEAPLNAGLFPDALIPFEIGDTPNLRAFRGRNHLDDVNFRLWIDFKVPVGQKPGGYHCQCIAKEGSSKSIVATVDLMIVVLSETLPLKPSLRSSFGISERRVARVHGLDRNKDGLELSSIMERYYQLMEDCRIEPCMIFGLSPRIDSNGQLDWSKSADGNLPAAKDQVHKYYNQKTFQNIYLPLWDNYPYADPLGSDRDKALDYLVKLARFSHQAAPDARLLFAAGGLDEPNDAESYRAVRQWAGLIQEASKLAKVDIDFFVTEQPEPEQQAWGSLVKSVDVWAPHVMLAWEDLESKSGKRLIAQRIAAGDEVWVYPALCQFREQWVKEKGMPDTKLDAYPPVWLTDYPAIHYRILPWICAAHGFTGIHYWSTFEWPENVDPWTDNGTFLIEDGVFNGDGLLIYPPASKDLYKKGSNAPCASIRLKWIRDGMEDHDHLTLLKKTKPELASQILSTVARGLADWEISPMKLNHARNAIHDALNHNP